MISVGTAKNPEVNEVNEVAKGKQWNSIRGSCVEAILGVNTGPSGNEDEPGL